MTNTLHRYGRIESFFDDYIIFAMPCKGKNDQGAVEKLRTFLRICARHRPTNMGNSSFASYRPFPDLRPAIHWKRDLSPDPESVVQGVVKPCTAAAVFDSGEKAEACLRNLVEADLGLSINISSSVEGAKESGERCGITRHSVEYSLGFSDPHDHLPEGQILELSTMCGHGMVSANLARKMLDFVREGRRSPEQAAGTLARFCPCGIYNPHRARRIMERACKHQG